VTHLVDDRYELGDLLATGGMADVYVAHDRTLDRPVAVKRLRGHVADTAARTRFVKEARSLARFSHPNAVAVYDAGEDADGPYIVMELVDGPTLSQYLRRRGPLPFADAARIAGQVLAALGAAHTSGIIHRDVKPANVLFAADGTVKLADFGIAKAMADAGADLTLTGQVIGTPKYLAPEQAVGGRATARSDVYAVGVLLYEMVTGEAPFVGETPEATIAAHQRAPVPSLRARRPDAPDEFVGVVEHALAKDPAQRYASADAMRAALAAADLRDGAGGEADPADAPTVPTDGTVTAVAPTAVLPAGAAGAVASSGSAPATARGTPEAARGTSGRPMWLWLVAAAVVVVLTVAAALLTGGGGDSPAPRATVTTVPTTRPAPTTTTPPPSVTLGSVQTLQQLAALLAAHPGVYGARSADLLAQLNQFLARDSVPTKKEASNLIEQVQGWVAQGQLDRSVGSTAARLLTPYARTSEPPGQAKKRKND
jgi:serine/threonine-protein kinase